MSSRSHPPPRPSRVYVIGAVAFVKHPAAPGLWIQTHPCVADRDCPACQSPAGVPCIMPRGYGGGTHYARRQAPSQPTTAIHYPKGT